MAPDCFSLGTRTERAAPRASKVKKHTASLSMANYKLVYLNYRGRAELIRFIFAQASVEYEDDRISPEEWQSCRQCKENDHNFTRLCWFLLF